MKNKLTAIPRLELQAALLALTNRYTGNEHIHRQYLFMVWLKGSIKLFV